MQILDKDTYHCQRSGVERIVMELAPGKSVKFDEASTTIKFYVRDETSGIVLTEPSGEWFPEELADKSDEWVRDFIKRLSNGKI